MNGTYIENGNEGNDLNGEENSIEKNSKLLKDLRLEIAPIQEQLSELFLKYGINKGISCGFLLGKFSFFVESTLVDMR